MPLHVPAGDSRSPIFLLTLTWEGEVTRYATVAVDVSSEAGTLTYRGGLTIESVEEVLDVLEPVQALRTVPMVLAWSTTLTAALADGAQLVRVAGELAVLADGDTWEERRVLLVGVLADPVDDVDGTVACSLVEDAAEDAGLMPDATAVVEAGVTWQYPDTGSEGLVYPWVFGEPGVYSTPEGESRTCPGSPMPQVYQQAGADQVMAAGHEVEAATLNVLNVTQSTEFPTETILRIGDLRERLVSVCEMGIADVLTGDDVWAAWTGGEAQPGSSGAGSLLRLVLARSRVAVDWARLDAVVPDLDRWIVGGYLDERVTPLQWVQDNLLPILPASLAWGPGGWYPAVWRWDAPPSAAVAHVQAGRNFTRSGPRVWEGATDVRTEIELSYALDGARRQYMRTLTATGDPALVGARGCTHHPSLRRAWTRHGRRQLAVQSDIVYRDTTASLTLAWLAARHGTRRGLISGDLSRRLWHLRVGDPVLYTDGALEAAEQLAYVRRLRWEGATVTAQLWMAA